MPAHQIRNSPETLLDLALNYWNDCISQNSLFARTDDLFQEREDDLPELANDIPWTSGLIFSLLSRSDRIVTYGNTHLAYGFNRDDSFPQSLGDIIAQILRDKFGGRARLNDCSDYLRDELRVIRRKLTSKMISNHPELVVTSHEIHLAGDKNAS
ncbi:MAG: hypothetical protein FWH27_15490 [Planctomycetaceae bacterium]|nr:hypothetical protein [Planctomycetaceae bacterium]